VTADEEVWLKAVFVPAFCSVVGLVAVVFGGLVTYIVVRRRALRRRLQQEWMAAVRQSVAAAPRPENGIPADGDAQVRRAEEAAAALLPTLGLAVAASPARTSTEERPARDSPHHPLRSSPSTDDAVAELSDRFSRVRITATATAPSGSGGTGDGGGPSDESAGGGGAHLSPALVMEVLAEVLASGEAWTLGIDEAVVLQAIAESQGDAAAAAGQRALRTSNRLSERGGTVQSTSGATRHTASAGVVSQNPLHRISALPTLTPATAQRLVELLPPSVKSAVAAVSLMVAEVSADSIAFAAEKAAAADAALLAAEDDDGDDPIVPIVPRTDPTAPVPLSRDLLAEIVKAAAATALAQLVMPVDVEVVVEGGETVGAQTATTAAAAATARAASTSAGRGSASGRVYATAPTNKQLAAVVQVSMEAARRHNQTRIDCAVAETLAAATAITLAAQPANRDLGVQSFDSTVEDSFCAEWAAVFTATMCLCCTCGRRGGGGNAISFGDFLAGAEHANSDQVEMQSGHAGHGAGAGSWDSRETSDPGTSSRSGDGDGNDGAHHARDPQQHSTDGGSRFSRESPISRTDRRRSTVATGAAGVGMSKKALDGRGEGRTAILFKPVAVRGAKPQLPPALFAHPASVATRGVGAAGGGGGGAAAARRASPATGVGLISRSGGGVRRSVGRP